MKNYARGGNVPYRWEDPLFKGVTFLFALFILLLTLFIAFSLLVHATPAIKKFGFEFLWGTTWDPVSEQFSALPFLYGTLITAVIALLTAVPIGLFVSIFLSEFSPRWLSDPVSYLIDLLAAIPSVIYGIIGLFVLVPLMRGNIEPALSNSIGFLPVFQGPFYGVGILTAGLLLSMMILPFIISISREVMLSVPQTQREAILSLGATQWEMVYKVVMPLSRSGIIGSIFLALARALGETMAVTMVIGNNPDIPLSFFEPGHTMAAVIANEFTEAASELYLSALIEIGLILFLVSFVVNGIARILIPGGVRAA
ncbi:MAG: phosphate ABC transporter permease subunit PstC [Nitrospirae bacterium]|nr:phosphate ABC transporter permease subunit PstC [Candidatus Troglogloeales bacterium]